MNQGQDQTEKTTKRLPYEDMSLIIEAGSLARLLAHKGIVSPEEFEWLVCKAYLRPRIELLTEDNWQEVRQDMLDFLRREDPKPPQTNPSATVQENVGKKTPEKASNSGAEKPK